jgi:hypothetical protein
MGICLALDILEHGADGGRHGGPSEAVDELTRESFWMTAAELTRAARWAAVNGSTLLQAVVDAERRTRRAGAPICYRSN